MDPNQLIGPSDDDYGRRKPFVFPHIEKEKFLEIFEKMRNDPGPAQYAEVAEITCQARLQEAVNLLHEARSYVSTWDRRHEECESCGSRDLDHHPECITVRLDSYLNKHPKAEQ